MNQYIANELRRQQRLGDMVDTRRNLNVPSGGSTNTPINDVTFGQRVGDFIGNIDDRVQTAIRRNVYGEGLSGEYAPNLRGQLNEMAAELFHMPRQNYNDVPNGKAMLVASRALQAGALTGAGYGLAQLTNEIASRFGGEKDEPDVGVLYM